MNRAACAPENLPVGHDADDWFAPKGSPEQLRALTLCTQTCPLYHACAIYALEHGIPHGVYGGLTEDERHKIWKGRKGGRPNLFELSLTTWAGPKASSLKPQCPKCSLPMERVSVHRRGRQVQELRCMPCHRARRRELFWQKKESVA